MDTLTSDEMAFFRGAVDGLARAQANLDFVKAVLTEKYGLQIGDQFTPEGEIIRLQDVLNTRDAGSDEGSASIPSNMTQTDWDNRELDRSVREHQRPGGRFGEFQNVATSSE